MKLTKEKEEQLAKLMKDYNASDLDELMDILDPDLVLEFLEDEDELPQQEKVDLDAVVLELKKPAVPMDANCPFSI